MIFSKGHPEPLQRPMRVIPSIESDIVSPRIGKQHNVPEPSAFGTAEFEKQLDEVVRARLCVGKDIYPDWLFEEYNVEPEIPQPLREFARVSEGNPKALASLVHMDDPSDLGRCLRAYAQKENIPLKTPPKVEHNGKEFLRRVQGVMPRLEAMLDESGEMAFEVKYFYMDARPETVLGIPGHEFTAYPEGCPAHPRYIAGHGNFAGTTFRWFKNTYAATPEQLYVARLITLHWAMYRTLAGVHLMEDNLNGWKFGHGEYVHFQYN